MLYGEKARFGIEFDLNDDPGGAWMFGKFCYWIGGEQIGNFAEGTSLRDVLFSMKYIVSDAGSRTAPSLAVCDERKVFRLIQDSLNESNNDISALIPSDLMPACFDICPHIDIFGACHIYLVDALDFSKIVYSSDDGSNVKADRLALDEFDAVISAAYGKFNILLEACE